MKLHHLLTAFTVAALLVSLAGSPAAYSADKSKVIRFAAMGDIMMGTENLLPPDEGKKSFTEVIPYLKDREVVLGNMEGPLTDRGEPSKVSASGRSYVFRTPPHYVANLSGAGFTVLTLANNHVNDYGPEGAAQTREVLEKAGILYTGAPGQVARQKVGEVTVSVIGLAPNKGCQNINDIPAAVELVKREAANPRTLVVVTFHGGAEGGDKIHVPHGMEIYLEEKRGDLRTLSHALIDAGAHLIVGHGPHVPRGVEHYKGRLIAYSLGNFATGQGIKITGNNGLAPLLLVDLTEKGEFVAGRVVSFRQNPAGRPRLDKTNESVKLMHRVSREDFDSPALNQDGTLTVGTTAKTKKKKK